MNKWEASLQRYYETKDPRYDMSEEATDSIMEKHIGGFLESDSSLMYSHAFVTASVGWLSKGLDRQMFEPYEERLVSSEAFAETAISENTGLLRVFDVSPAPHYTNICNLAVSKSWRALLAVDPAHCEDMVGLSARALQGAYDDAARARPRGRSNRFIRKIVLNKLIPIAAEAGMSNADVQEWKDKFNAVVSKSA